MAAVERHRAAGRALRRRWSAWSHGRLAGRRARTAAMTAFAAGADPPPGRHHRDRGRRRRARGQRHRDRACRALRARPAAPAARPGRPRRAAVPCLLLYRGAARAGRTRRLAILRETEDGFAIAEEDLRLRGPGEVLGMRQSGLPGFRFADLAAPCDLLADRQELAERALAGDPARGRPRGRAATRPAPPVRAP